MRALLVAAASAAILTLGACDDKTDAPAANVNINVESQDPAPPADDRNGVEFSIDSDSGDVGAKVKTEGVDINIK